MEPQLIFEDDCIMVVNKPSGLIVNRSETTKKILTLQDWLIKSGKIPDGLFQPAGEFFRRSGIVHRLDKETSGLLIVAKNELSFDRLQQQFKIREVKKYYLALAHGQIVPDSGEINVPVGRLPWHRTKYGIIPGGRPAKTCYRMVNSPLKIPNLGTVSLVELSPYTGRTHQIRVHLSYLKHPVVGDNLYAGRKVSRSDRQIVGRVMLHAWKIKFRHPINLHELTFEAQIPLDFIKMFKLGGVAEEILTELK